MTQSLTTRRDMLSRLLVDTPTCRRGHNDGFASHRRAAVDLDAALLTFLSSASRTPPRELALATADHLRNSGVAEGERVRRPRLDATPAARASARVVDRRVRWVPCGRRNRSAGAVSRPSGGARNRISSSRHRPPFSFVATRRATAGSFSSSPAPSAEWLPYAAPSGIGFGVSRMVSHCQRVPVSAAKWRRR